MDQVLVQLITGAKQVDTAVLAELEAENYIVGTIADNVCFFQIVSVLGTAPSVRPATMPRVPPPDRPAAEMR
jgi:hypothetical protein